MRDPLPGAQEWADALDLTRRGREWVGPCPLCGGDDRFHVRDSGAGRRLVVVAALTGNPKASGRSGSGEVLRAAFPGRTGATARSPAKVPRSTPRPINGREAARRAIAGRLWAAMVPADDTPARAYLARRSVWPPGGIGPDLPASVRWLPRGAVGRDVAANWYDVPAHTAGAIVYAFRQPGGAQQFERSAWTPWTRTGGGPTSGGGAPSVKRRARCSWRVRWAAIPS